MLEAYLGRYAEAIVLHRPGGFRRDLFAAEAIHRFAGVDRTGDGKPVATVEGPQALPQAVLDTVTSLAFAIDAKDHYTQGHSQKVSAYAALIAESMNMTEAEVEEIRLGAVLHDIGKVGIPENILNKSGPLNPEEWETMKSHVIFGAKILEPLTPLARIREMVLHHHEFFDGSGYPDALDGERYSAGREDHRGGGRVRHDHQRPGVQEGASFGGCAEGAGTLHQCAV